MDEVWQRIGERTKRFEMEGFIVSLFDLGFLLDIASRAIPENNLPVLSSSQRLTFLIQTYQKDDRVGKIRAFLTIVLCLWY